MFLIRIKTIQCQCQANENNRKKLQLWLINQTITIKIVLLEIIDPKSWLSYVNLNQLKSTMNARYSENRSREWMKPHHTTTTVLYLIWYPQNHARISSHQGKKVVVFSTQLSFLQLKISPYLIYCHFECHQKSCNVCTPISYPPPIHRNGRGSNFHCQSIFPGRSHLSLTNQ